MYSSYLNKNLVLLTIKAVYLVILRALNSLPLPLCLLPDFPTEAKWKSWTVTVWTSWLSLRFSCRWLAMFWLWCVWMSISLWCSSLKCTIVLRCVHSCFSTSFDCFQHYIVIYNFSWCFSLFSWYSRPIFAGVNWWSPMALLDSVSFS